jgi:serine/threonine-protein kinase
VTSCPTCNAQFDKGEQFCPQDGSPLSERAETGVDPLVGRVLGGRYRIAAPLGQGGMGTVYRAVHTLMDKPLAVKILRGELATDAEAVARFHREARSASRLDHDHCIRVTDFGQTEDGLLYLAMELLEGRSLGQRIREGRLSITDAVVIVHAVAQALEHAHEAGVIHRDLKPDNVFLARRSRGREVVKVLDFGLAKLASDSSKSRSITRDGTVFGTPEYMAPEQAQGDPLDARTDLYSLGVLFYHLITGTLPFRAETFVALLTKHIREAPLPPREHDPAIPPALERIVLTCLAKRREDRFASASDLVEALAPFVPHADATGPTIAVPQARDDARPDKVSTTDGTTTDSVSGEVAPRRPMRWIAAALAAVVLLGGGGWLARSRGAQKSIGGDERPGLGEVRRLTEAGKLDEAAARLEALHRERETSALEQATAEVAERRGRRLEALAHLHRAKTLAPDDARIRTALASLLLRLGQKPDACRQATESERLAIASDDRATMAAARGILKGAACTHTAP